MSERKLRSSRVSASAGSTSQPKHSGRKATVNVNSNEDEGTRDDEPVKAKKSEGKCKGPKGQANSLSVYNPRTDGNDQGGDPLSPPCLYILHR